MKKQSNQTLHPVLEFVSSKAGIPFGRSIQVKVRDDGEPLFIMKHACDILGIKKYRDATKRLDEDETCPVIVDTSMGPRTMQAVTESGLYHLISKSRKPEAREFSRWVRKDVLPAIRKMGFYADPDAMLRVRDYMSLRQITGSVHGFGQTCMAVCRQLGAEPELHRKRGHAFPVRVLDEAAKGREAGTPPLLKRVDVFTFTFNPNA